MRADVSSSIRNRHENSVSVYFPLRLADAVLWLIRLLHLQDFDRHSGRHEFEPEAVQEGLFQALRIWMPGFFSPSQINAVILFEASFINYWHLEVTFQIWRQALKARSAGFDGNI